jgi:phosphinothricin acetyltransferase
MSRRQQDATRVRPGAAADLPGLNDLYNHYVTHTTSTFDVTPIALPEREAWFRHFGERGPYRLLVAENRAGLVGFACSKAFRTKEAYATSVETTVYIATEALGRGIGTRLYTELFDSLEAEGIHRAYAGITLPNEASVSLHRKLGFHAIGTYHEVGWKFERYWSVQWFEKALA